MDGGVWPTPVVSDAEENVLGRGSGSAAGTMDPQRRRHRVMKMVGRRFMRFAFRAGWYGASCVVRHGVP